MKKIQKIIIFSLLSVSLLSNAIQVIENSYLSHRFHSNNVGIYSLIVANLTDAVDKLDEAEQRNNITKNLDAASQYIQESDGLLRGIALENHIYNINFHFLYDPLDTNLFLPMAHDGSYSQQEMKSIKTAIAQLKLIRADISLGTSKGATPTAMRHAAEKLRSDWIVYQQKYKTY